MKWYAIVGAGTDPRPARGPHKSIEAAEEAVERFREKYEDKAGTFLASGNVRLLEFDSRESAREGDISGNAPIVKKFR